jgi:PAS domain S-box-containing protein
MGRFAAEAAAHRLVVESTCGMPESIAAALFDQLAATAARALAAPAAFVCVADADTQAFIGRFNWPLNSLQHRNRIGIEALRTGRPVSVCDTHVDPAACDNPFVTAPPHVRSYTAAPILSASGGVLGLVGIAAHEPRAPPAAELMGRLADLASLAALQLEVMKDARARLAEQREVDAHARKHEAIFRQIVETANEGVWLVDAEARTIHVNRRMAEICGYTVAEMIGRPFFDFLSGEAKDTGDRVWATRRLGIGEQHEMRFIRPDGSEVETLVTATPTFDEHGAFSGAVALVADISELKATEQALKRSEAELSRAQRMAHLGHWTWRPDRNPETPWQGISIYSPAGAALFGVTPEELMIPSDAYVERFVHPDDRAYVRQTLLDHGGPRGDGYSMEHRILRADGEVRTVREVAELLRDAEGRYLHTIGVIQDITESKRAEVALRESETRFRTMADTMPNLLWMADADGKISFLSRRWEEYSGIPTEQNIGRVWALEAHPDDAGRLDGMFRSGVYPIGSHEIRLRAKDGQYRWFLDTAAYRYSETGEFLGYIGTLTFIDDMRRLSEQLHQSQKMEAVGQLTGGIAHDFNNLLTIILGNAEMLEEQIGDARQKKLAAATRAAAERSAALVRRLLAFSRRQPLQPVATDVNELIAGMHELIERTLGASCEIGVAYGPDLPSVVVDRAQLESSILNLAINARDAMPEGGRLSIETAATTLDTAYESGVAELTAGDYVMIAVSDTGCGMSEEVKRQAFEPFFTTKDVGRGTGLGLSMVYGFVKQSGGHIRLYSEVGRGTSVKMYFRRGADEDRPAARSGDGDAAPGRGEKILVVEDDERVREYVVGQLVDLGYRVVQAANGPEALQVLQVEPDIALLLTDVVMPGGMNGRQLADEALRRKPDLKVIFTTGYTRDAIVHDGRLDPDIELLSKPYPRRELAAKVRAALDRQRGPAPGATSPPGPP